MGLKGENPYIDLGGGLFHGGLKAYASLSPTYALNFMTGILDGSLTFTRSSNAWSFNSSGAFTLASTNVPRFDYDPLSLALKGLLIEQASTNYTSNSTMVGASVGTFPTTWVPVGTAAGIAMSVVNTGTEFGMPFVDILYSGTTTGSGGLVVTINNYSNLIAASNGQTWTGSLYTRIVGGSTANFSSLTNVWNVNNSSGTYLSQSTTPIAPTASLKRSVATGTIANAAAAYVYQSINTSYGGVGNVINLTLRVYQPQLEISSFASSPIPTSTAAVTRAQDVLNITSVPWWNAAQGSFMVQYVPSYVPATTVANNGVVAFSDGTSSNLIGVKSGNAAANYAFVTTSGGTAQYNEALGAAAQNIASKIGMSFKSAALLEAQAGANLATHASYTMPTGVSRLDLGTNPSGTPSSGWFQQFNYWNSALSSTQLNGVTT